MFKTTKEKKKISDISMKIPGIQRDLNYTAVLEIVKYEKSHYERFGCYDIDIIYKIVNTCTPNPITKLSISDYKIIQSIKNVPTEKSYYFYCVKDSGEKLGPSFFLLW